MARQLQSSGLSSMSLTMQASRGFWMRVYARMPRKVEYSACADNWLKTEAIFPTNGNFRDGSTSGDGDVFGGGRCREPVRGLAQAPDAAGDRQPARVRAGGASEDAAPQSNEPALHAHGFGRSVYPGLSTDPRPA